MDPRYRYTGKAWLDLNRELPPEPLSIWELLIGIPVVGVLMVGLPLVMLVVLT